MSDERERLAKTVNSGIQTASGCFNAFLAIMLFFASPLILLAAWGLAGAATNSDGLALVVAGIAAVAIVVAIVRLAGWGR